MSKLARCWQTVMAFLRGAGTILDLDSDFMQRHTVFLERTEIDLPRLPFMSRQGVGVTIEWSRLGLALIVRLWFRPWEKSVGEMPMESGDK